MPLPDSLTKFDAASAETACKPRRFYEAIVSRPRRAVEIAHGLVGIWSHVPPVRCLLTREGIDARLREGFFACILREFDELPQ